MKLKNVLFLLAIICISTISCGKGDSASSVKRDSGIDIGRLSTVEEVSKQPLVNIEHCTSVFVLKKGVEAKSALNREDAATVLTYLSSGVYDQERNDSGIKYKMVEPSYTFVMEFEDGHKELAQYWVESALILYNAKWYNPISAANIQDTLTKYFK